MIQVIRVGVQSASVVVRVEPRSDSVSVVPIGSGAAVVRGDRWWQGSGPPPELIVGAQVGDMYWDTVSGDVFELTIGT